MVLGKHNARAHVLAGRIARRLGHKTVVAPVISYVPEGAVSPSGAHAFHGHLERAGTGFRSFAGGAARSLVQHGFRTVVFLGTMVVIKSAKSESRPV